MEKLAFRLTPFLLVAFVFWAVFNTIPERSKVLRTLSSQVNLLKLPDIDVIFKEAKSVEDIVPIECSAVKPVTYTRVVSLKPLNPPERKRKFMDLMLPSVLIVNYEVKFVKENLEKIKLKLRKGLKLHREEVKYLENLMDRCKTDSIEEVLKRANPVPPSLVIAQAAIESGWGTSRFFVEGNNPFGIWAFKRSEDTIQALGSRVRLRKYPSILDAVRDYLYNVNVGWAYESLREERLKSMDPFKLSEHLGFYSIKREKYVEKVKEVIAQNNLTALDSCSLDLTSER